MSPVDTSAEYSWFQESKQQSETKGNDYKGYYEWQAVVRIGLN